MENKASVSTLLKTAFHAVEAIRVTGEDQERAVIAKKAIFEALNRLNETDDAQQERGKGESVHASNS